MGQEGKLLRVQGEGDLGGPLEPAVPVQEQGPSGALPQPVQAEPRPVEDRLQRVHRIGAVTGLRPEKLGQFMVGEGAVPFPDQGGQQQAELLGPAADRDLLTAPSDHEAAQHLDLHRGNIHGGYTFLWEKCSQYITIPGSVQRIRLKNGEIHKNWIYEEDFRKNTLQGWEDVLY